MTAGHTKKEVLLTSFKRLTISKKLDDIAMNQTCKVCGEPAAGFHFGAFTCEGCKSFFGRSYNNMNSMNDCKNDNNCVINKKNRTSCKSCRLRKCLRVGMSKNGSRYGRRSNWFKIHCLLQEQQQQQHRPDEGRSELLHPPLTHYIRPRDELMLDRKSSPQSMSSPDSHTSDTSLDLGDVRRLNVIPNFPPFPFPHPMLLSTYPMYQNLLQASSFLPPFSPAVINNNNNIHFGLNKFTPPSSPPEPIKPPPVQEYPIDLSTKSSSDRDTISPTRTSSSPSSSSESEMDVEFSRPHPVDLTNKS